MCDNCQNVAHSDEMLRFIGTLQLIRYVLVTVEFTQNTKWWIVPFSSKCRFKISILQSTVTFIWYCLIHFFEWIPLVLWKFSRQTPFWYGKALPSSQYTIFPNGQRHNAKPFVLCGFPCRRKSANKQNKISSHFLFIRYIFFIGGKLKLKV